MLKQQGWLYYQAKPIQTLGRASQGVNWSWSQFIKSHQAQTSSGKRLPSHFWNRNIKVIIKVWSLEEDWRGTESKLLKVQCEVSEVCDDLRCLDVCWSWSIMFYQVQSQCSIYQDILEHVMLPSADKLYGDADFLFQQDLAPAHSAKTTSKCFADHDITLLDWPHIGYFQEKDEKQSIQ